MTVLHTVFLHTRADKPPRLAGGKRKYTAFHPHPNHHFCPLGPGHNEHFAKVYSAFLVCAYLLTRMDRHYLDY